LPGAGGTAVVAITESSPKHDKMTSICAPGANSLADRREDTERTGALPGRPSTCSVSIFPSSVAIGKVRMSR
ncbi:MAG TPA: hypothetical protein VF637_17885, partial [Sphingomicrobium sp.]